MNAGLRFVMVTTFYPPYNFGGDGTYIRRLAHALIDRGHTVDIIHEADAYRVLSGKEPDALQEPEGLTVHRLETSLAQARTPSLLATQQTGHPVVHGRRIKKLLERGNYDVIHFHNISLVGGPGVLAYGDAIKLYTAHEHWLVCPSHILWRHEKEVCTGRECLRCVLNTKRPPQLWRQTNLLEQKAKHVDEFCALSQFSADKHREFGFTEPMTVVPSFLPAGQAKDEGEPETPYFLFVGRLEKIKGLQDVIPHFDDDAPAELWIVGDGDYEPELRQLAEGKRKVRFLGKKPPEAIPPLYKNALALLTPSVCYEVFPLVVLEAFREGTPIIARDLGPYPEIVNSTQGGMLFSDGPSLKAAIADMASNHEKRQACGQAGLHAFETRWTEKVSLARYFDMIKDHAGKKGKSRVLEQLKDASDDGFIEGQLQQRSP